LAFLNQLLLLPDFFLKTCQGITFQITGFCSLVTCNIHLPQTSGQSRGAEGRKRGHHFPHEPHGHQDLTALGLLRKHTARAAARSKGVEITGRGRETKAWSCHFSGITPEKTWVRRSGHRPDRWQLSPTTPASRLYDDYTTLHVPTAAAEHIA